MSPGRRSTDSAEPAIFGDVPFRNPHFTGRERMLEQLHGQLWTGTTQMALLPHAVHGLGGVGKTQLAIEYAWRYAAEYDVVWWVPSESQSTARRALVELADRMEIAPQAEVDQRIVALLNALRVGRPYRRWLLVYDNAQSPDQLQGLLPVPTGHVLITSRDAEWSVRAALLEVNVFSRAESVTLLQRRGAGIQADVADRLADVLGDLPLALDQAAAWQAQTGTPAAELVRLLSERMPQLLRDQVPGRPASVMATWDLAFAELRRQSPGAARLLELLAFFGAEPVAIPILRDGRRAGLPEDLARVLGDDLLLRRAIRDINRYALAKVHPSEDRMEVHRLVQTVLRDRLTPEQAEETRDSVHRILGAANPGNPDVTRTHERHAELWPHITPSRVIFGRSREGQRAALDQIRYRFNIGDYASSMRLGRAAVEAWRASLGADDELTLIAQRHLAIAIRERGEYAEAAVLNQDTFARVREVFGENHEHTLATRISLSRDLRLQGRFEECKVHDEETLTLHLTRFGDDDPETIKARNNLATTLRCLGRGDDALAIDEANRAVAARIFGELHSSALGVWANLGRDLIDSGRYKEAVRDLTTVAALAVEHWGPGHRMSLRARMNLAIALRRSGELERARALAEELHKAVRELMPPRHETVLSATVTYANAVLAVGEAVRAVPLLEEAWQGYRAGGVGGAASGSAFGPDHPFSQAAAVDLAVSLRAVGENRRARELDEQAVTSLSGTVGPDHPYTLVAQINLALDLSLAHEHSRARQLSGDAFERSQRSRGADRPETLICGLNHALDLRADGADDAGHELLVRMRGQLLDRYGSGHPAARAAAEERRGESDLEHWDT